MLHVPTLRALRDNIYVAFCFLHPMTSFKIRLGEITNQIYFTIAKSSLNKPKNPLALVLLSHFRCPKHGRMIPRVKIDRQGIRSSIYVHLHTIRDFALEKQVTGHKPLQSTHYHTNNQPRVAVMRIAKIICMHKIKLVLNDWCLLLFYWNTLLFLDLFYSQSEIATWCYNTTAGVANHKEHTIVEVTCRVVSKRQRYADEVCDETGEASSTYKVLHWYFA